jgi:hypothetical protein
MYIFILYILILYLTLNCIGSREKPSVKPFFGSPFHVSCCWGHSKTPWPLWVTCSPGDRPDVDAWDAVESNTFSTRRVPRAVLVAIIWGCSGSTVVAVLNGTDRCVSLRSVVRSSTHCLEHWHKCGFEYFTEPILAFFCQILSRSDQPGLPCGVCEPVHLIKPGPTIPAQQWTAAEELKFVRAYLAEVQTSLLPEFWCFAWDFQQVPWSFAAMMTPLNGLCNAARPILDPKFWGSFVSVWGCSIFIPISLANWL